MRARVSANGPCMEDVEVKIELTMPIRQWRKVIDQTADKSWPVDEMRSLITEAMRSVLASVELVTSGKEVKE